MNIAAIKQTHSWAVIFSLAVVSAFAQSPGTFAADAELRAVMAWVRQRAYDRIPSIDAPHFVAPSEAGFLEPNDEVVGIELNGQIRAYPLRFLNGREVVNDTLARTPLAVTW